MFKTPKKIFFLFCFVAEKDFGLICCKSKCFKSDSFIPINLLHVGTGGVYIVFAQSLIYVKKIFNIDCVYHVKSLKNKLYQFSKFCLFFDCV